MNWKVIRKLSERSKFIFLTAQKKKDFSGTHTHVSGMLLLGPTLNVCAFLEPTCPRVKNVAWDRGSQHN